MQATTSIPQTLEALTRFGKASAEVAVAVANEWPTDDKGKRAKAYFVDVMSPAIVAAGHDLTYNTARVYASVVDTLGAEFWPIVDEYGWTQANEAARRNTGNRDGAVIVLETANRDSNGDPIVGADGKPIRATVGMVKATADDLADSKGKGKAKRKPLTVTALTQADIRKHDTDAISEYVAKLTEQIKRANNVLRARDGK